MSGGKASFENGIITVNKLINEYEKGILKIPKIQRNIVWNKDQKSKLQDSIKQGFPLGVIFFSEINGQKYIIDGLQRTTTIMDIFKNIFKNINEKDLETYIKNAISLIDKQDGFMHLDLTKKDLEMITRNLKKHLGNLEIQKGNFRGHGYNIGDYFSEIFWANHKNEIKDYKLTEILWKDLVRNIYNKSWSDLEIDGYQIPFIKFIGSPKQAIDLFTRINTKGTKLNKTDILRSHWSLIEMKFNDQKIIQKIEDNFKSIIDFVDIKHEEVTSLTPFDIIWYIFQEVLSVNWNSHISKLFSGKINEKNNSESNKQIDEFDSLMYLIKLHLVLKEETMSIKDFDDEEIGERLKNILESKKDVEIIIDDFKKVIEIYDGIFKSFADFRGNKVAKNNHTLLPGVSYSVAILGNIYNYLLSNKNVNNNKFIKEYEVNFILKYIDDLLGGAFGSSSSKKAFSSMKNGSYLQNLDFKIFKNKLEGFFQETKKNSKDIEFKDDKSKTIMAYLFIDDTSISDNNLKEFQYDHLVPKSRLKNLGISGITCFANLSWLFSEKNNEKSNSMNIDNIKEDVIYKWAQKNEKETMALELYEAYEKICNNLNQNTYNDFLDKRVAVIYDIYQSKFQNIL